jgi:hypothetical protein
VAVFLYLLIYSRTFDWLTGAFVVVGWLGALIILTLGFNALLKVTGPATVPLLIVMNAGVVFSAIPHLTGDVPGGRDGGEPL